MFEWLSEVLIDILHLVFIAMIHKKVTNIAIIFTSLKKLKVYIDRYVNLFHSILFIGARK